jgi:hypothetical protein
MIRMRRNKISSRVKIRVLQVQNKLTQIQIYTRIESMDTKKSDDEEEYWRRANDDTLTIQTGLLIVKYFQYEIAPQDLDMYSAETIKYEFFI